MPARESDSFDTMSKTFRPWDFEQRWLLPPLVHELVPAGHVAHFVRDTVREELDLSVIFSAYELHVPEAIPGPVGAVHRSRAQRPGATRSAAGIGQDTIASAAG
jgi:hypothetical protein